MSAVWIGLYVFTSKFKETSPISVTVYCYISRTLFSLYLKLLPLIFHQFFMEGLERGRSQMCTIFCLIHWSMVVNPGDVLCWPSGCLTSWQVCITSLTSLLCDYCRCVLAWRGRTKRPRKWTKRSKIMSPSLSHFIFRKRKNLSREPSMNHSKTCKTKDTHLMICTPI